MAAIKFHLDQHVPNVVAHGLRQLGADVTTTFDAGLQDADDPDHLAFALNAGRTLVTHDAGFLSATKTANLTPEFATHHKRSTSGE